MTEEALERRVNRASAFDGWADVTFPGRLANERVATGLKKITPRNTSRR